MFTEISEHIFERLRKLTLSANQTVALIQVLHVQELGLNEKTFSLG